MKKMFQVGFTLALICAVCATLLAFVNGLTAPKIAEYENSVMVQALKEVSGEFIPGEKVLETGDNQISAYYRLVDTNGNLVGYILQLVSNGYGGGLSLTVSYDVSGTVLNAKLLTNSETPGLGKKAEAAGYMDKFIGKGDTENIPLKKDQLDKADADSVGGATVTFTGISKAISHGSQFVHGLGGR